MAGVAEAGAEDALVAGDDGRAAVDGLDVGGEGEARGGGAGCGAEGEVTLVDAHADLHDFGRQVHEGGVDAAEQGDRPFDEAGDFVEQAIIGHDGEVLGSGEAADAVANLAAALCGVRDHVAREQAGVPGGEGGGGESAGGVEAVAFGLVAAAEVVAGVAGLGEVEGDDGAIEHAEDAAERADPGEGAAVAPAHAFRPGKAAQQGGKDGGDEAGGGRGGRGAGEDEEAALLGKLVAGGAVLAEEAFDRLGRRGGAGAAFDGLGGGDGGVHGRGEGDAAGPEEGLHGRGRERSKRFGDEAGEVGGGAGLHAGRDLLAEQLEQQFRHQARARERPPGTSPRLSTVVPIPAVYSAADAIATSASAAR